MPQIIAADQAGNSRPCPQRQNRRLGLGSDIGVSGPTSQPPEVRRYSLAATFGLRIAPQPRLGPDQPPVTSTHPADMERLPQGVRRPAPALRLICKTCPWSGTSSPITRTFSAHPNLATSACSGAARRDGLEQVGARSSAVGASRLRVSSKLTESPRKHCFTSDEPRVISAFEAWRVSGASPGAPGFSTN